MFVLVQICESGFYNAWQGSPVTPLEIYCWSGSWHSKPHKGQLNQGVVRALDGATCAASAAAGNCTLCVRCPSCVLCSEDSWNTARNNAVAPAIMVQRGFGLVAPQSDVPRLGRLDLLKCPENRSCLTVRPLPPPPWVFKRS